MKKTDFTTSIEVDQSPDEVFNAVANVRGWWSEEIEGATANLDDEFVYHFEEGHYAQIKLVEVIPNQRIVWFLKYNYFNFTKDRSELTGTSISFEISDRSGRTELRFTHHGLEPEVECFEICSNAWTQYIQKSLFHLITTGKGEPNGKGKPTTADEKKLLGSTR